MSKFWVRKSSSHPSSWEAEADTTKLIALHKYQLSCSVWVGRINKVINQNGTSQFIIYFGVSLRWKTLSVNQNMKTDILWNLPRDKVGGRTTSQELFEKLFRCVDESTLWRDSANFPIRQQAKYQNSERSVFRTDQDRSYNSAYLKSQKF